MSDARYFRSVLDRDPKPHMYRPWCGAVALPEEVAHEGRAFCEDLKRVPRRTLHSAENAIDETLRNVLVEEIAHGIYENHAWRAPAERLFQPFRAQRKIEASLEWMTECTAKPFREALGITVIAPGTDFRTASYRVPGRVSPFDCCH